MEDINYICFWIKNDYNFATNQSLTIYPRFFIKFNNFIKNFHKMLNGKIHYIDKMNKYFIYIYKNENFRIDLNYEDWLGDIQWRIEGDIVLN